VLDLLEAAEALIYSDPAGALALASRAAVDPTLRVRADTLRAIALARTGELVQSVGVGTRVLEEALEPQERARLMNVLGAARDLLGQTTAAVEVFERALSLGPGLDLEAKLRVNLAVALARLDWHEPAIEHLQAAAALGAEPARMARIQLDLAISQRALGDLVAGAASLDEAARLAGDPTTPLLIEHQRALLDAGEGRTSAAMVRLRALVSADLPVHLEAATWQELARLDPDLDSAVLAGRRALGVKTESPEWAMAVCTVLVERLSAAARFEEALIFQQELAWRQEAAWAAQKDTELALLRVQLEVDRLRDESEALAAANTELGEALREKDEFVAIASHDLRSPLSAIQMAGELLEEEGHPLGPQIARSSERMGLMLSKLVHAHAADATDAVATEEVAAEEVAERVAAALASRAADKGARIVVSGAARLLADPEALARVLTNGVENALKFGASSVWITIEEDAVEILDDGPGFTAEDLERAFGKFARLSARPTGAEPSTGLGLYIIKRLVEAMGGAVALGNREPQGARLTLRLRRPRG